MWVFRRTRNSQGYDIGYIAEGRFVAQWFDEPDFEFTLRLVNYLNGGDGLAGPAEQEYKTFLREELRRKWGAQ